MPSKDKPSKKAVREKKEKAIEDNTFGLKNKNKSKKVQQFISRVEKSVNNSNGAADAARAKEAKKESKLAKQLQEEELRVLFNEGLTNQFGKKKSKAAATAAALGVTEASKEVKEFYENISSSSSDDDDGENGDNGPIYLDDDVGGVEVFREKTIEDLIEEQRAKLSAEGKVGTPVTEESFKKWRTDKIARKQAEAEARMKMEQMKKKGGKGLSVLSGKELFNFNSSLFVDDDGAIDEKDEKEMNVEANLAAAREEQRIKEETARAQAENERLAELHKIELLARQQLEEDRKKAAEKKDRITFKLGEIEINQVVFDEEEKEDLTPFLEEKFSEVNQEESENNGVRIEESIKSGEGEIKT